MTQNSNNPGGSATFVEELENRLLLSFDYSLGDFAPLHVVRGHDLWVIVSGQSPNPENECENVWFSTTTPTGLTASWPGNSYLYYASIDDGASVLMKISAASDAPLGATSVTVTGDSSVTHVIRTNSIDVVVDAVPSLPTPEFNCGPQPIYDANNPNALANWESAMISKGQQFSDPTYLAGLSVGNNSWAQQGVWYYDGERVFYQIKDYIGNSSWPTVGAEGVEAAYRPYVINCNGAMPGYMNFAEGLRMDYFLETDPTERSLDYSAVQLMSENTNPWWSSAIDGSGMRETAYSIESKIQARKLGITTIDAELAKQVDEGIGQLELLCVEGKFTFVEPFMVGLLGSALIEWYDYTVESSLPTDTRIPAVIKYTADWLIGQTNGTWNAWDGEFNSFYYSMEYPNGIVDNSTAIISRGYDNIGLNNLIAPMFGWLYHMYGETSGATYRQWGDKVFGYGSTWDCYTGKQFSQNYRETIKYTQWRLNNDWANDNTAPTVSTYAEGTMASSSSMYVTWRTSEATSSIVEYGPTTSYGSTLSNSILVTKHRQEITNLTPGATYHYRIKATDASGNYTYSADRSFVAGQAAVVVGLVATDNAATENSADSGYFTVTRSSSSGSLTVNYTISGSAGNGTDYQSIPGSVVFNNGETSKTISITALNDSSSEATEFVTLTLNEASGYDIDAASGNTTAMIRIYDDDNPVPTLSVSVLDGTANENTAGDTAKWRLTRTGTTGAVTVNFTVTSPYYETYSNNGVQWQQIPTSISFAAGEMSKDITLTPIDDDFLEGNVPIDLTIIEDAAVSYRIGSPSVGTVYMPTNDSTVSITASDASASESGDTATFTITRTCYANAPATVYYTIGGTASNGSDYTSIPASVYFASDESTKTITISPIGDSVNEDDETVILTLTNPAGCQYNIAGSAAATVTIANVAATQSTVTVSVVDGSSYENTPGDTGTWRITRSETSGSLTVYYTVTCEYEGYANNGTQYQQIPTSVTFADGEASKDVVLTQLDDDYLEGQVPIFLTLTSDASYIVGSPSSGYVYMWSNDSTVSISASDASGSESGDAAVFTISRGYYDNAPLTVYYTIGGTASNGSDYTSITSSVSFASNESSKTITISPIQDGVHEDDETVVLTLTNPAGCNYNVQGGGGTATATIANVDVTIPTVNVSVVDGSAYENTAGDTATWRITRSDTASPLTVYYTITCQYEGYVNNGVQYQQIPTSVTFAAGESSKDVVLTPNSDDYLEGNVPVVLTITSNSAYIVGTQNSGTVYLPPNDSLVSISASDASAAEQGNNTGTFVISREYYDNAAITVYYTISGTATSGSDYQPITGSIVLAANESSRTITIAPINDRIREATETVVLTLVTSTGCNYNLGTSSATVNIADND